MRLVVLVQPKEGDSRYEFSTNIELHRRNRVTDEFVEDSEVVVVFDKFSNAVDSLRILTNFIKRAQADANCL